MRKASDLISYLGVLMETAEGGTVKFENGELLSEFISNTSLAGWKVVGEYRIEHSRNPNTLVVKMKTDKPTEFTGWLHKLYKIY